MSTSLSPFTQCVVSSVRHLYPESLADHSFDNTGLLLSSPINPHAPPLSNRVLLTIDLTRRVADEALRHDCSVIVAYHPIIFRGLKALTTENSQQETLLRLAQRGVSVYCPHTAVDAVPGGMADWLARVVRGAYDDETETETEIEAEVEVITPASNGSISAANSLYKPLQNGEKPPYASDTTGSGRLVHFKQPQDLRAVVSRVMRATRTTGGASLAIPQGESLDTITVRTVALCNGSGGSVIRGCSAPPDLVLTGELSHHETLAMIERGGSVVTLSHSNSERGYLRAVMQEKLTRELEARWSERSKQDEKDGEDPVAQILKNDGVEVIVSEIDSDPYRIVRLDDEEMKSGK